MPTSVVNLVCDDVMRRRLFVWLARSLAFAIAFGLLLVWSQRYVQLAVNTDVSLPDIALVLILKNEHPVLGQYVAYTAAGNGYKNDDVVYFKIVAGMPGDIVDVQEGDVFVGARYIGVAKRTTTDGRPLSPIAPGRIPAGYLFAAGVHVDSFDSRYAAVGLVDLRNVIGRVVPLF